MPGRTRCFSASYLMVRFSRASRSSHVEPIGGSFMFMQSRKIPPLSPLPLGQRLNCLKKFHMRRLASGPFASLNSRSSLPPLHAWPISATS